MKILLTGKDGQVGRALAPVLRPLGELTALGRAELDLENISVLPDTLRRLAPDLIVNAAAYTAVDKAESEQAQAIRINAEAVAALADYAKQHQSLLVHYSTDYVFDGAKPAPYTESDAARPLNIYGQSKLAGEQAIQQSGCNALIFRTSWVVSAHGHNFIKTILRLAATRADLDVVADQHGAPTSAALVAGVTAQAITSHRQGRLAAGLYHLAASGETTWHGFATHIVTRARANNAALQLQPRSIRPITTQAYPTPARRPRHSRLDCGRLSQALDLRLPDWKIHVDPIIDELTKTGLSP